MPSPRRPTVIERDLVVTPDDQTDYSHLAWVGGRLFVTSNTTLNAPLLLRVSGSTTVDSRATLTAPTLASIGGQLHVYPGGSVFAPVLQSVGEQVVLEEGAALNAPSLGPGSYKKRYVQRSIDSSHSRCDDAGYCVEHALDPRTRRCR